MVRQHGQVAPPQIAYLRQACSRSNAEAQTRSWRHLNMLDTSEHAPRRTVCCHALGRQMGANTAQSSQIQMMVASLSRCFVRRWGIAVAAVSSCIQHWGRRISCLRCTMHNVCLARHARARSPVARSSVQRLSKIGAAGCCHARRAAGNFYLGALRDVGMAGGGGVGSQ